LRKLLHFGLITAAVAALALQFYLSSRPATIAESVVVGEPASQWADADGVLGRFSTVPDFTLTERSGASVKRADLEGKVWFADFVYSNCPDICKLLSSSLSDLQAEAFAQGEDVRFVSFSVDPEQDTPEVLQGYAAQLRAGDRWLFLTGEKTQMTRVAREGFLLGFEQVPGVATDITHSTKIALVDRKGVVRRFYNGTGPREHRKMLADLKALLKETP
jgi:protein SCO1/2